jgi:predicted small lipoprotein YifL
MFQLKLKYPRRRLILIALVLMMVTILLGCGSQGELSEGDKAPDFSLQSSAGDTVSLAQATADGPALLFFHMAQG